MNINQQRQLDYQSQQLINQLIQAPNDQTLPITQLYFDVAIKFGKMLEYRLLWFRFDHRKLYLLRSESVRTELLFSSFSYVTLENGNPPSIKLVVTDFIETPKTYEIITQSENDRIQIFELLRSLSTVPTRQFYRKDYYLDYVNKKMKIICKKLGTKTWARREMIIYNGLFILYSQSAIPRTLCPLSDRLQLIIHPNNILEVVG